MVFGFVLALGMDMAPFSTLVVDPVHWKRVAWTEVIVFNLGDMRVLVVELLFIVEGTHEVFNVRDFWIAMLNECTYAFLLVGEGGLLLILGSCDMLRGDSMYMAWVSGHGGVAVNADVDASVIVCEARRGVEGIDSGI
jgi:hypothetical protein